jgi:HK97 gp10 family phage protein
MKLDLSEIDGALDALANSGIAESLARRMAVEGGVLLRDEVKARAPVDEGDLRDAIYLAFRDRESNESQVMYRVTWNDQKAWYGRLIEFGHFRPYFVGMSNGKWFTAKGIPNPLGAKYRWEAQPFMAPAWEARKADVMRVMIERGRKELPILLAEIRR